MSEWCNLQAEALIAQIKERTGNLYQTRQLLCAEAVVVTLNKALDGGLSDAQAVAVAAPFSIALGDSGCICGALSGAVLACGLFVGNGQPYPHRQRLRKNARLLHDAFKTANGATCCRVLSRSVHHDRQAHFQHCARLTAGAAEMAARLILYQRPELIQCTESGFLNKMDTRIGAIIARLLRRLCQLTSGKGKWIAHNNSHLLRIPTIIPRSVTLDAGRGIFGKGHRAADSYHFK